MNQPNLLQPQRSERVCTLRRPPHGCHQSQSPKGTNTYWERLRAQMSGTWKRFQGRQIKRAIAQYDSEKHFLRGYQAVVGQATMRMVHREIERNKLPFYADKSRPWLKSVQAMASPFVAVNSAQPLASERAAHAAGLPAAANGLPSSLREPVQRAAQTPDSESASQAAKDGVVFDLLAKSS